MLPCAPPPPRFSNMYLLLSNFWGLVCPASPVTGKSLPSDSLRAYWCNLRVFVQFDFLLEHPVIPFAPTPLPSPDVSLYGLFDCVVFENCVCVEDWTTEQPFSALLLLPPPPCAAISPKPLLAIKSAASAFNPTLVGGFDPDRKSVW
eukprot:RCo022897